MSTMFDMEFTLRSTIAQNLELRTRVYHSIMISELGITTSV